MKAHSASRFLAEFSGGGAGGALAPRKPGLTAKEAGELQRQQEIARAYERGLSEAKAQTSALMETALAAQREDYEARLAQERATWIDCEAVKIADQIRLGLSDVETQIADVCAKLLRPIVEETIRMKAVSELALCLRALLKDNEAVQITGSMPPDLLDKLRAFDFGSRLNDVRAEDGQSDIRLQIAEAVVETRIGDWIAELQGALA